MIVPLSDVREAFLLTIVESVDFAEIEKLQHQDDWVSLNKMMVDSAKNLENAKADFIKMTISC